MLGRTLRSARSSPRSSAHLLSQLVEHVVECLDRAAIAGNLRSLSVNLFGFVITDPDGFVLVERLQNGVPVPAFSVGFGVGPAGILSLSSPPIPFAIGSVRTACGRNALKRRTLLALT